jgi:hypothetical protein
MHDFDDDTVILPPPDFVERAVEAALAEVRALEAMQHVQRLAEARQMNDARPWRVGYSDEEATRPYVRHG